MYKLEIYYSITMHFEGLLRSKLQHTFSFMILYMFTMHG
jgi:hypothetical protein